jgi:hypothetical protein
MDKEVFIQPSFSNIGIQSHVRTIQLELQKLRPSNYSDIVLKIDTIPYKNLIAPSIRTIHSSLYRHLIVFVPGYRGSHYDFKLFKTYLSIYFNTGYEYFMPTCNDFVTEIPVEEMAQKLAESLDEFITHSGHNYDKISFVCHSLGGIILRTAMKNNRTAASAIMKKYQRSYHTLITLNTPHLGSICNKNVIVNSAIWFLKSWKGAKSLQQLDLNEGSITDSLIYNLAFDKNIGNFKNIILVASESDSFVSSVSALMTLPKLRSGLTAWDESSVSSEKLHEALGSMIGALEENTSNTMLIRCRVTFNSNRGSPGANSPTRLISPTNFIRSYREDKRRHTNSSFSSESGSSSSESCYSFSDASDVSVIETESSVEEELVQEEAALRMKQKSRPISRSKKRRKKGLGTTQFRSSTLDKITGKAYHTALLNNSSFINGFINMYKDYLA